MTELTLPALPESIPAAAAFVEELLCGAGCPVRIQARINIAVDEILSNIVRCAYPGGTGDLTLQAEVQPGSLTLTFADRGVPFDPLSRQEPDTRAPLAERPEGGLGLFLVKKIMDQAAYRRQDGQNLLTISKSW